MNAIQKNVKRVEHASAVSVQTIRVMASSVQQINAVKSLTVRLNASPTGIAQ
jgi:hypothetical protein